jgi:hypothetical protein
MKCTEYTIAAWVKPRDVTSVNVIASGSSNPSDFAHQLRICADSKFEHFAWDGQTRLVTGTTTVQSNTWYHVAIVAGESGMVRLYVNGVEEGEAVGPINALWTLGDRFYVGKFNPGGGFFNGLVDDLKFYEHAFDASQIQAIYEDSMKSTARVQIETSGDSIVATGSRFSDCEPGVFPTAPRDTAIECAAGSFEYVSEEQLSKEAGSKSVSDPKK